MSKVGEAVQETLNRLKKYKKTIGLSVAMTLTPTALLAQNSAQADNLSTTKTEIQNNNKIRHDDAIIEDKEVLSVAGRLGLSAKELKGRCVMTDVYFGCTTDGFMVLNKKTQEGFCVTDGDGLGRYAVTQYKKTESNKKDPLGLEFSALDSYQMPEYVNSFDEIKMPQSIRKYFAPSYFSESAILIGLCDAKDGKTVPLEQNPFYKKLMEDNPKGTRMCKSVVNSQNASLIAYNTYEGH